MHYRITCTTVYHALPCTLHLALCIIVYPSHVALPSSLISSHRIVSHRIVPYRIVPYLCVCQVPRKGLLSLHYEAEPGTEAFDMRLRMATGVLGWEFEPDFDVRQWTREEVRDTDIDINDRG